MTLGQKLRQTRLSKGLSQSQVAGGCVTRNMLSQIENDQASPSMRTLEHLARALDVSVGWLLSDEQTDAALEKMRRARTLFREEDYAGCLALLRRMRRPAMRCCCSARRQRGCWRRSDWRRRIFRCKGAGAAGARLESEESV